MAKVDLVFRQVGERTSEIALDLAIRHLQPENVHVMDDVRPFSECVNRMLRIRHDSDYVVYVDADCLILEDMRGFIDRCRAAYVDSYVSDRFRGRIHCGVHITRIDLVRHMAEVEVPEDDLAYVLRPESRLRGIAMRAALMSKQFHNFDILHDHFQYYGHIFEKYALRELRSRKEELPRLNMAMQRWPQQNDEKDDFTVARHAIDYARRECPADRSADEVDRFIRDLPRHAAQETARMGIAEKGAFTMDQLDEWLERNNERQVFGVQAMKPKVFGVGLSRTGTRSLNSALQILGFNSVHYPLDPDTYNELANGQYDLTLLKYHDGVTDITVAPFYAQLDKMYPDSKFILTVREKDGWLRSCENHWRNSPYDEETQDPERLRRLEIRRFFRASTYGCYEFEPERFSWVYDRHVQSVMDYFKDQPDRLLVINVCAGEGFEKLVPFLGCAAPCTPFPHNGSAVSKQVAEVRARDEEQRRRAPESESDRRRSTIAA
jgi:hypothetical protein